MGKSQPMRKTGPLLSGFRYQHLFTWLQCLEMLRTTNSRGSRDNKVQQVDIEANGAGNFDDLVVHYASGRKKYMQTKWAHDDREAMNTEYLLKHKGGKNSLFEKFIHSWQRYFRELDGSMYDIALVSNMNAARDDVLMEFLDSDTEQISSKVREGGARSKQGILRRTLREHAQVSEETLLEFLEKMEFKLAYNGGFLERQAKNYMDLLGMKCDDEALERGVRWISQKPYEGRIRLDRETVECGIKQLDLWDKERNTAVLSVATLLRDDYAEESDFSLDWWELFEGDGPGVRRRPRAPATWAQLHDDILETPRKMPRDCSRIKLRGSIRLAPAFVVGTAFPKVQNYEVEYYKGDMWRSDEAPGEMAPLKREVYDFDHGGDLAVLVNGAIASPQSKEEGEEDPYAIAISEVNNFIRTQRTPVDRLVCLSHPGSHDKCLKSCSDLNDFVVSVRDKVRSEVRGRTRIHLFLAVPLGVSLLLGHRWNRMTDQTLVYEDVSGKTGEDQEKSPRYEVAFIHSG